MGPVPVDNPLIADNKKTCLGCVIFTQYIYIYIYMYIYIYIHICIYFVLSVTQSMLLDMVDCLGALLRAPIPNKIRANVM